MAIINLPNSSPSTSINTDTGISVVRSINNAQNQKILARKRTANVAGARVLNDGNLIVNSNRVSVSDFNQQQPQTITSNSITSGNMLGHTSYTLKQPSGNEEFHALSTLLLSTAAADRPDIIASSTSPLVVEKLQGLSGNRSNVTQNFKTVVSPLSSPPSHAANPINVQNFVTPIQLQLGYGQSILSAIQGQHGFIVSVPVTTATVTCTASQQTSNNSSGVGSAIGLAAFGNSGSANLGKMSTKSNYTGFLEMVSQEI